MRHLVLTLVLVGGLGAVDACPAGQKGGSLWSRERLSDNWLDVVRRLEERGIGLSLDLTQAWQLNLHGGQAVGRHAGRYAGSYDLQLELDLEKLLGLRGAVLHAHAEGGWSDGLDASSIGSAVGGVNDDAPGDRAIDLTEFFYAQKLLGGKLRIHVGKVDMTGGFDCHGCPVAFDGSAFANDETRQFLNSALVNNPTIPFPNEALGMIGYLELLKGWYLAAGAVDARGDLRETGFRTTFHGRDHFFSVYETGVVPRVPSPNGPLQGAYRVGFWYDPQPKDRHDGSGVKRDDMGLYLSFDQMLLRESAKEDDTQGLGLFARYGWADDDVNDVGCFWSVGAQYQGLIPTRDDDVVGFGVAQGRLPRAAGFARPHETVFELYYRLAAAGWLSVSPSIQYVMNPGAGRAVDDAVVVGFRVQMSF